MEAPTRKGYLAECSRKLHENKENWTGDAFLCTSATATDSWLDKEMDVNLRSEIRHLHPLTRRVMNKTKESEKRQVKCHTDLATLLLGSASTHAAKTTKQTISFIWKINKQGEGHLEVGIKNRFCIKFSEESPESSINS